MFNTEKEAPVHVRSSARISRYRDAPSRETGEVDKRASRAGEASNADARADLAVACRGDKQVGEDAQRSTSREKTSKTKCSLVKRRSTFPFDLRRAESVCHAFFAASSTSFGQSSRRFQDRTRRYHSNADTTSGRYQRIPRVSRATRGLESGRPVAASHFEPRFAGFRANVHGRSNGALGAKTRRERRWRSARRSAGASGREFPQP